MYVPVHRVPIYHDLTYDFASAKHTLVIVIMMSLIIEITRGVDALSLHRGHDVRRRPLRHASRGIRHGAGYPVDGDPRAHRLGRRYPHPVFPSRRSAYLLVGSGVHGGAHGTRSNHRRAPVGGSAGFFWGCLRRPGGSPPPRGRDHPILLKPGASPVAVRSYMYLAAHKDELERQCAAMIEQGIVRRSTSAFSSPVLLVKTGRILAVLRRLLRVERAHRQGCLPDPRGGGAFGRASRCSVLHQARSAFGLPSSAHEAGRRPQDRVPVARRSL